MSHVQKDKGPTITCSTDRGLENNKRSFLTKVKNHTMAFFSDSVPIGCVNLRPQQLLSLCVPISMQLVVEVHARHLPHVVKAFSRNMDELGICVFGMYEL